MRDDGRQSRATPAAGIVGVLAVILVAGVLLAGCGGGSPAAGPTSAAASPIASSSVAVASPLPTPTPTPASTPTPTPPPLDKPTKKDPLRVYFGGDSLAGMPGVMLAQLTAENRLAKVRVDYVESSRLTYGEPMDWPARVEQQMNAGRTDVGVFMIGANDSGMPMIADGESTMYPDKKWLDEYERRAKRIATIMLHGGAKRVYWVGMPIMPDSGESAKMRKLNELFENVARSSPDVVYVDSYDLLAKKNGDFNAALRSGDGVHYTNEGAMVVAEAVWEAIKKDWRASQEP